MTATTISTTRSLASNIQTAYGICGGLVVNPCCWPQTICDVGLTCTPANSYYWICLPTAFPNSSTSLPATTTSETPVQTTLVTTTKPSYPPSTTTAKTSSKPKTTTTKKTTATKTTTTATSKSTTSSTTTPPVTTTSAAVPLVPHWAECGGFWWTEPTVCEPPYTCIVANAYFSNCF
ncbi:hypothetical protein TWF694_007822 [Orbilia ellipsospora]|uniref:CBM1 domain-containing protein n=1 Tax=Orbilia ellipsospora TaxID=2528407 RepID=A0AAV9XIV6_9PEZI